MSAHILRIIVISVFSFMLSFAAYAQTAFSIENSTKEMLHASDIPGSKLSAKELNTLVNNAKMRLASIQANIEQPHVFLKWLLPNKITKNLPTQVQPYLEKQITNLEGTIEIRAIMAAGKRHEVLQYLLRHQQDVYYLHFNDTPPPELQTDARVRIHQAFLIPTSAQAKTLVLSSDHLTVLKQARALPLSFGPQSTIAMLVNFSDGPSNRPWTMDQVKNLIFTDINNFYREMSYGQTSIVGQVTGWFVLNMPSTTLCDDLPNRMESLADQAAKNAGVDLTQFKRKVYIFPKTSTCSWSGLGTVGGTTTRAFVNGSMSSILVTAHELGHNMGLRHAQALRCPTSPIEGSCTVSEYGDGSDVMGNSNAGHFNAFQKDRLGWLNYQSSPPITTVTQSGSYFIDAYETMTTRPKALKVLKRAGTSDYYYLELRQGIGFDKVLECGTSCDFTKGIVFHQGNISGSNPSQLLDMSPGSGNQLVALLPCQSWKDPGAPNGGVTFAVQSISSQGARVLITYGGLTQHCQRQAPTVSVLPSYTQWLNTNETKGYTIVIKNNDNETCSPRQFDIDLASNANLSINMKNKSLKIVSGSSQIFRVSMSSRYKGMPFLYGTYFTVQDKVNRESYKVPLSIGLT